MASEDQFRAGWMPRPKVRSNKLRTSRGSVILTNETKKTCLLGHNEFRVCLTRRVGQVQRRRRERRFEGPQTPIDD